MSLGVETLEGPQTSSSSSYQPQTNVSGTDDTDELVCKHCGKEYKTATWLQKHIKDKHDASQSVQFTSPDELRDYVTNLGVVEPLGSTEDTTEGEPDPATQASPSPTKVDFEATKEQIATFITTFNTFLDNMISMAANLDIVHYSAMSKAQLKAMAGSIEMYMRHSGVQVSPAFWLGWNLLLTYGSITASLPAAIRNARKKVEKTVDTKVD